MAPKLGFYPGKRRFQKNNFPGEKPILGAIFWVYGVTLKKMAPKLCCLSWKILGMPQKMAPKLGFYPGQLSLRSRNCPG